MLADRRRVALAAEIARERLFADHVLARLHGVHDHRGVQIGRRADVDDVDLAVRDQIGETAMGIGDAVAFGERDDMVAARGHRLHLDIDTIDAPVCIHMQFRHEAAAGQPDPDLFHGFTR